MCVYVYIIHRVEAGVQDAWYYYYYNYHYYPYYYHDYHD